jgi:hypothetical protein
VYRSAERLWQIGLHAENEADVRLALIAFRTIRRGFHAAESFYTPGKEWIHRCDIKIAALTGKNIGVQRSTGGERVTPGERKFPAPDIFWTIMLEVGFLGWIGSVTAFLIHALTEGKTPRLRLKPAFFWGTMVIVFFSMWIVGMAGA